MVSSANPDVDAHDTVEPAAANPLAHAACNVDSVTLVEECASNRTFAVFPSGSPAFAANVGVVSAVYNAPS